jgi:hypothetical protein
MDTSFRGSAARKNRFRVPRKERWINRASIKKALQINVLQGFSGFG